LAAGEPVSLARLSKLFTEEECSEKDDIKAALDEIQEEYDNKCFKLVKLASGYTFQVQQEVAPWLLRLWEGKAPKYTRATLETLALIAYRQPLTRAEIEEVRGVAVSSHIMKSLQERNWIKELGHKDVPGRPTLWGTTKEFLDYFNLKTLDELPTLMEIQDLDKAAEQLGVQLDLVDEAAKAEAESDAETAELEEGEVTELDEDEAAELEEDEMAEIDEESMAEPEVTEEPEEWEAADETEEAVDEDELAVLEEDF